MGFEIPRRARLDKITQAETACNFGDMVPDPRPCMVHEPREAAPTPGADYVRSRAIEIVNAVRDRHDREEAIDLVAGLLDGGFVPREGSAR